MALIRRNLLGLGDVTPTSIQQQIINAANAAGVPPSLALAVAQQESSFNPNATGQNKNSAGQVTSTDYGLFQLNSSNLAAWGVTSPLDPTQNINAGVAYLAQLLQQYGGNATQALEAYNGGPGAAQSGSNASYASSVLNYQQGWTSFDDSSADDPASADASTSDSSNTSASIDPTTLVAAGAVAIALAWALLR